MTTFDILEHLSQLASDVEDDKADAIEALATVRHINAGVTAALRKIDPKALEAAEKHPKNFTHAGISWRKSDGSKKYDFSKVPAISQLKDQVALEEAKSRAATDALVKHPLAYTLDGNGDVYNSDGVLIGHPAKLTYGKPSLTMEKG